MPGLAHTLRTPLLAVALVFLSVGSSSGGQQEPRGGNPVIRWNRIATEIFPVAIGPILDARAMAILHAAIHDAVNGVEFRYEAYTAGLFFPGASVDSAVASAARVVMLALIPSQQVRIEQEYAAALADVRDGPAKDQGVMLGQQAARANLDRRNADGIAPGPWPPQQGPITEPVYVPTGAPGDYDFTPPFDAPPFGPIALFPGWGRLTPFAVDLAHHRLHGPDPLQSKRYARDFNFVKANGSLQSSSRTPDQTDTAFFWFEPFAVWNDIAVAAMQEKHVDPWQAARILALMNFAIVDASIVCFDAKYDFRFWRPYTAIRRGEEDGNDRTAADRGWLPLLWTPPGQPLMFLIPPIPDYPSAAAIESAAAAVVLTSEFGDSVSFAVSSKTLPGAIRRFNSFARAAQEAGMSRVFGGIHFVRAVEDGWAAGRRVGREVSRALRRAQAMKR
jgi:hypothetical protein